ncbi:MAG: phosphatidylserine decarboxylase [Kiritimatiellae bacterium]|nr:phosphatidylserine decarboxylase [Kiritimatiellia bacterium]
MDEKNKEPEPDFSNSAYLFPPIHPEGVKFGMIAVFIALAVAVAAWWLPWLSGLVMPLLLLAYGVFLFFRNPERYPPEDENAILSPADGRVCLVQEVPLPEELGEDQAKKYWRVSVFMSVFNVHVNRMPTAGEIVKKVYVPGKFLNASLDKASKDNERCNYLVKAANGAIYGVTQIAGLVARRIVPFVDEGAKLERAERFGLIRFGSRLDVYLPEGVKPAVRIGQIMVAGETVLGRF